MNKRLLAVALALGLSGAANAADVRPLNADAPGVGLNDPTPATPVGGNYGTTVGEQRREPCARIKRPRAPRRSPPPTRAGR